MSNPVSALQIAVLGPVAIAEGDTLAPVRGQQGRVLCLLVAAFPHPVPTDRLVDALWGDDPPETATSGLSVVLHRLRTRLGGTDRVVHHHDGYRLDVPPSCIDACRFIDLVDRVDALAAGRFDEACELLTAALELWRGGAFEPFADTPALQVDVSAWSERRLAAEDLLLDRLVRHGARFEDAAALAQALVAAAPYRERRWVGLARSLYQSGRQTEALRATSEAARLLRSEVGVEPGEELRALEAEILAQAELPAQDDVVAPDGDTVGTAELVEVRSSRRAPVGVQTTFVGRDDAVETVAELLQAHRLVTVVGSGGAGKTRLATQMVRSTTNRALWIDLSATAPDAIAQAIASELGIAGRVRDQSDQLARALGSEPTLVVLDNCEHAAVSAAETAGLVLDAAPDSQVLATSRIALDHVSETVFAIPPLDVEASCRLLLDRAFGPGTSPQVDPQQVRALVERLDRNPLLIEMVAEPVRALSVEGVNDQLERVLGEADRQTGPARQGSLEATIDWSLQLMSPATRECFDVLGVMRGAFTASEVANLLNLDEHVVAQHLQVLCRHGLLTATERTSPLRFRQPEAVSIEARRRLDASGSGEPIRATHTDGYLALVAHHGAGLWTADEPAAVGAISLATDQLSAVHERLVAAGDAERAARLAITMWDHAFLRLDLPRFAWAGDVLKIDGVADLDIYPDVLATAAMAAWAQSDFFTATRLADEAIATAPNDEPPLEALRAHFNVASFQQPITGPIDAFNDLITHTIARGAPHARCDLEVLLSVGLLQIDETDGAADAAQRALATAEQLSNPSCLAWATYGMGWTETYDDPAAAARRFVDAGRLARSVQNRFVETMARGALATCMRRQGRLVQARVMLADVIGRWDLLQTTPQLIRSCREAALLLADFGEIDKARSVLARIELAELGHPLAPPDQLLFDDLMDRVGPADEPLDVDDRALGQRVLELLA